MMAAMKDLDIHHDKVNVHGGAVALAARKQANGRRAEEPLLFDIPSGF